ncbi:hypothetical protein B0T26DRAFT_230814 [Lasiosphaeria miniovina]|uniref:Uncharacterized protein n=1 Tax=Lasiosphaeria miniovina TaxID=1954250 RepID=A0AA40AVI9_9PEZI|nr:uncharacterized protein B0T26DRAFT_230814 [Lasiosphaeria miniovina]KAK0722739.1 hypothetical protein B0T26DRAFT_230814 [Lasiosphaeria miniovina]
MSSPLSSLCRGIFSTFCPSKPRHCFYCLSRASLFGLSVRKRLPTNLQIPTDSEVASGPRQRHWHLHDKEDIYHNALFCGWYMSKETRKMNIHRPSHLVTSGVGKSGPKLADRYDRKTGRLPNKKKQRETFPRLPVPC